MNNNAWLLFVLLMVSINFSYACVFDSNNTLYGFSIYETCPSNNQWPTRHHSTAVSAIFGTSSITPNAIEMYVWREGGYIWAEMIPVSGRVLIVGSIGFFTFHQNGYPLTTQVINSTQIMQTPDLIQPVYLEEPTVFLVSPHYHSSLGFGPPPNIQEEFILRDYGLIPVTLNVPVSANAGGFSGNSSVVDCSVVPYYENGIVYIPCARVPDGAGGMSIFRTSWTIIPNRQPLSLELHSLEVFAAE
jgi:hypothetical protein